MATSMAAILAALTKATTVLNTVTATAEQVNQQTQAATGQANPSVDEVLKGVATQVIPTLGAAAGQVLSAQLGVSPLAIGIRAVLGQIANDPTAYGPDQAFANWCHQLLETAARADAVPSQQFVNDVMAVLSKYNENNLNLNQVDKDDPQAATFLAVCLQVYINAVNDPVR